MEDTTAVCYTPNAAAGPGRCYFRIAMPAGVEKVLGPDVDRVGVNVAAMIKVNSGERIVFSQNISDTVGVAGLHRC